MAAVSRGCTEMTQPRTIHRRNARKRAKVRVRRPGIPFVTADWLVRDSINNLTRDVRMMELINREYPER